MRLKDMKKEIEAVQAIIKFFGGDTWIDTERGNLVGNNEMYEILHKLHMEGYSIEILEKATYLQGLENVFAILADNDNDNDYEWDDLEEIADCRDYDEEKDDWGWEPFENYSEIHSYKKIDALDMYVKDTVYERLKEELSRK